MTATEDDTHMRRMKKWIAVARARGHWGRLTALQNAGVSPLQLGVPRHRGPPGPQRVVLGTGWGNTLIADIVAGSSVLGEVVDGADSAQRGMHAPALVPWGGPDLRGHLPTFSVPFLRAPTPTRPQEACGNTMLPGVERQRSQLS